MGFCGYRTLTCFGRVAAVMIVGLAAVCPVLADIAEPSGPRITAVHGIKNHSIVTGLFKIVAEVDQMPARISFRLDTPDLYQRRLRSRLRQSLHRKKNGVVVWNTSKIDEGSYALVIECYRYRRITDRRIFHVEVSHSVNKTDISLGSSQIDRSSPDAPKNRFPDRSIARSQKIPAVRFARRSPRSFVLGSNEPIDLVVKGDFPKNGDVLVLAWSDSHKRMVDKFTHSLRAGPWQIDASKLELLPAGRVQLQLLRRRRVSGGIKNIGKETRWIEVANPSAPGGGEVKNNTTNLNFRLVGNDASVGSWLNSGGRVESANGHDLENTADSTSMSVRFSEDGQNNYEVGSGSQSDRSDDSERQTGDGAASEIGKGPPSVDGWTSFEPSHDTRKIHVSAIGDDRRDGLTPRTAVRTPERGYQLLRHGYPDWLLLRRGDTFDLTGEKWKPGLRHWSKSGRSAIEPMLMGAFGDSMRPRPLIQTNGGGFIHTTEPIKHVAFVDLHIYANRRDPVGQDFNGGRNPECGIRIGGNSGKNILLEGLLIEFYSFNVIIEAKLNRRSDITLRRCVLRNAYHPWDLGHSSGLFAKYTKGLTIDQCVFYHNGWNEKVAKAGRTGFNHNMYISSCHDVRVENNLIASGSFMGIKLRSDFPGDMRNVMVKGNVFIENRLGIKIDGDKKGQEDVITTEDLQISHNVFTKIGGTMGGTRFGRAIVLKQVGDAVICDNLIVQKLEPNNWWAIEIDSGRPFRDVVVERNTIHDWPQREDKWLDGSDELLCLSNNLTNRPDALYIDSSRRIDCFVRKVARASSLQEYLNKAVKQSKSDWHEPFTANSVVRYLREGFTVKPFD